MSDRDRANNPSQLTLELQSESLMLEFGAVIANAVTAAGKSSSQQALLISLSGDLGAGKTTLSRGILNGLGHSGAVKSPTYTLVEPYQLPLGRVCHFDFYRLIDAEELEYMGFQDYLVEASLCLIEWPERGEGFLPDADIRIGIIQSEQGRILSLSAGSELGGKIVTSLEG